MNAAATCSNRRHGATHNTSKSYGTCTRACASSADGTPRPCTDGISVKRTTYIGLAAAAMTRSTIWFSSARTITVRYTAPTRPSIGPTEVSYFQGIGKPCRSPATHSRHNENLLSGLAGAPNGGPGVDMMRAVVVLPSTDKGLNRTYAGRACSMAVSDALEFDLPVGDGTGRTGRRRDDLLRLLDASRGAGPAGRACPGIDGGGAPRGRQRVSLGRTRPGGCGGSRCRC